MPQTDFMYHVSLKYFDGSRFLRDYNPDEMLREYFTLRDMLFTLSNSFGIELSYSKVHRDLANDLVATAALPIPEVMRSKLPIRGDSRILLMMHRTQRPWRR